MVRRIIEGRNGTTLGYCCFWRSIIELKRRVAERDEPRLAPWPFVRSLCLDIEVDEGKTDTRITPLLSSRTNAIGSKSVNPEQGVGQSR